jgi:predicted  nucleic acid-binding Zn-ribbon protein
MIKTDPELPTSSEATMVRRDLKLLARFAEAYSSFEGASLEVEAEALRIELSPEIAKLFAAVMRRRIAPVVATMVHGVCGECNITVPTGLASSILANRSVRLCLRCKRILRPVEDDPTVERRASGPAR